MPPGTAPEEFLKPQIVKTYSASIQENWNRFEFIEKIDPKSPVVIGFSRQVGEQYFEPCEVVGRITNKHGVANEETTDHPEILRCRQLRESWPEFWRKFHRYG